MLQRANLTNDMKEKFPKEHKKGEISYKNYDHSGDEGDEKGRHIFVDKSIAKDKLK